MYINGYEMPEKRDYYASMRMHTAAYGSAFVCVCVRVSVCVLLL